MGEGGGSYRACVVADLKLGHYTTQEAAAWAAGWHKSQRYIKERVGREEKERAGGATPAPTVESNVGDWVYNARTLAHGGYCDEDSGNGVREFWPVGGFGVGVDFGRWRVWAESIGGG